jgi:hypothetical protein
MDPGTCGYRNPCEFRSAEKGLCPGRHAGEKSIAARGIQFPENIIQKEQWRPFVF